MANTPTLLGIPVDATFLFTRAADAPPKIREAMRCRVVESMVRLGVDLSAAGIFADAGDIEFGSPELNAEEACTKIEKAVGSLVDGGRGQFRCGETTRLLFLW